MIKRKFKKVILGTSITALLLTGCGAKDTKSNTTTQSTTQATTATQEQTTQATTAAQVTEEPTTQMQEAETETDEEIDLYNEAATLYNDNVDFFSSEVVGNNMAYLDDNGINIERIEDVVKVIHGEVADLTPSRVEKACENIAQILHPQALEKKINFAKIDDEGMLPEDGKQILKIKIPKLPRFSTCATDKETKEYAEKTEALLDLVIDDINDDNKISSETEKALEDAVYEIRTLYTKDLNSSNHDSTSIGNKIYLNSLKMTVISAYVTATGNCTLGDYVVAPRNEEELTVWSRYSNATETNTMTERDKEIFNNFTDVFIGTDIKSDLCSLRNELAGFAKDNEDVHSRRDELKELYTAKKIYMMEYKQNIQNEYNNVNKTLC